MIYLDITLKTHEFKGTRSCREAVMGYVALIKQVNRKQWTEKKAYNIFSI